MREHIVGWAPKGQLLFRTWIEGVALFDTFVRHFPELEALCVMPEHTHVLGQWPDAGERLVAAQGAYTRWRNATRHETGGAWGIHPAATRVVDARHGRRTVRYIHLNPVRDHLVRCPLAWPLSTHRDACGLVIAPVVEPVPEPEELHRYVSSDPDAKVEGTPFPRLRRQQAPIAAVIAAASAAGRFPVEMMSRRGAARELGVALASLAGIRDASVVAGAFAMSRSAAYAKLAGAVTDVRAIGVAPDLLVAATLLNDPRFYVLQSGDLRTLPSWRHLRNRR
jgi:REP element-mobilizing transposase RayT